MAVKWELLKERSGLINHGNYSHATAESSQCFILMAGCEFSNKWQESWAGKERWHIREEKKRPYSSKKYSHCCFCYYTMKHQSSQFPFCMLYHKHDFSFLGACYIPKYLTPEKPYFRGRMSKIAVTGTEKWMSYPSLVHTEPWLLPTALQSCVTASVGSLAGLWNLPLWEKHMDRTFGDSLLSSSQDQDGAMCHVIILCMDLWPKAQRVERPDSVHILANEKSPIEY